MHVGDPKSDRQHPISTTVLPLLTDFLETISITGIGKSEAPSTAGSEHGILQFSQMSAT